VTTRVGAVGVEETTGTGGLLRSGGRLEAFPMPLGSERTLGLAGPNGTPLIGELPAPADPAGGVSCAKACPDQVQTAEHGENKHGHAGHSALRETSTIK